MALALPRSITVVTGGAKDAKKFNELFQGDEDEWVTIDLKPHLKKSPGDAIGYKADSSHAVTQQLVMSQSGSPEIAKYIIKVVEGGGKALSTSCSSIASMDGTERIPSATL